MHVVTGKPVESGGSLGREKATGQGVVILIEEWLKDRQINPKDVRFFVQGFGNVGSWAARLMKQLGSKLVAVEDISGAIANPMGIDPENLMQYAKSNQGIIKGYPRTREVEHDAFLSTDAEIFIPAAMENQINGRTALLLNVQLVAEGANGPTDLDGDEILQKNEIDTIPDILCNAGGVIVSYFEWLQNKRSERWSLEEVDEKLRKIIVNAYQRVKKTADQYETDWRTAAYIVALSRLQAVYKERGIFP